MNRHLLIFISICISLICLSTNSDLIAATPDYLKTLDSVLKKDHISQRISHIDSLKNKAKSTQNPRKKWNLYYRTANEYASINLDSSFSYLSKAHRIAPDDICRKRTDIKRASLYNGSLMMHKETSEILDSILPLPFDSILLYDYYLARVQLNSRLEGMTPDSAMKAAYAGLKQNYRDSILLINPNAISIRVNNLIDRGDYNNASRLLGSYASEDNANTQYLYSQIYNQQGNREGEKKALSLAATADVRNGLRKYRALPRLATLLYEEGDLERAYTYMQRAIEDAKACNAKTRILDSADTMSLITDAYTARQKSSRKNLTISLSISILLLICVGASLYYARQRNKLLKEARNQQEIINARLTEAGNVRERYVRHFMFLSLEYIRRLRKYRSELFKIASKKKFEPLYEAIKGTSIIDKVAADFYNDFDDAFLRLYPNFVEEFNSLLRPEERVILPAEQRLNTELRIFALMRLGITESAEIADFLQCSQSTVYNYRTRYRAKALDKDNFQAKIFNTNPTSTPT